MIMFLPCITRLLHCNLTPGSAAPPTAASGGGAKPRNELEPFVNWHITRWLYQTEYALTVEQKKLALNATFGHRRTYEVSLL